MYAHQESNGAKAIAKFPLIGDKVGILAVHEFIAVTSVPEVGVRVASETTACSKSRNAFSS
jgi:hypothetical protein